MNSPITHENMKRCVNCALSDVKGRSDLMDAVLQKSRQMKTRMPLRLALAVCMLALIAVSALALAPSFKKAGPNGTWTYEKGSVIYQGLEDKYARVILKNDHITHISPDTENTGALYYITRTEDGQYLNSITYDGYSLSRPKKLNSAYTVRDMVVDGSSCYLIVDTDDLSGIVIRTDVYPDSTIQDEAVSAPGFENEYISRLSVYDRLLIAYSEKDHLLTAVDLAKSIRLAQIPVENILDIQAGNRLTDAITAFCLTEGGKALLTVDLITGETKKADISVPEGASGLQRSKYALYITDKKGSALSEHNISRLSGKETTRTLTLVNISEGSPDITAAISLFNEKYPDVEVVTRYIGDYRAAATELMAGEGGIDVLQLTGNWSVAPIPTLLKNGAIVDLTDNEYMIAARDGMRDVWALTSESGRQYGAVSNVEITMWEVNPILSKKLGWTPPEGRWTIREFRDLAKSVIEYNKKSDRHMYLLADSGYVPNFFELYDAKYLNTYDGKVNYLTDEFSEILNLLKFLNDNRLLYTYPKGIQTGKIGSKDMLSNVLLRVNSMTLGAYGSAKYILPPTYTSDDPLVADTYALVANANSDMKEEAAYFVSIYASKAVTRNHFYLNYGQFIDDKNDYAFINMPDIRTTTPENEAKWNYALEHAESKHTPSSIKRIINGELLPAFFEGKITEEEFMSILQMQSEMVLGE